MYDVIIILRYFHKCFKTYLFTWKWNIIISKLYNIRFVNTHFTTPLQTGNLPREMITLALKLPSLKLRGDFSLHTNFIQETCGSPCTPSYYLTLPPGRVDYVSHNCSSNTLRSSDTLVWSRRPPSFTLPPLPPHSQERSSPQFCSFGPNTYSKTCACLAIWYTQY